MVQANFVRRKKSNNVVRMTIALLILALTCMPFFAMKHVQFVEEGFHPPLRTHSDKDMKDTPSEVLAAAATYDDNTVQNQQQSIDIYDAVIVGAGWAGIRAALTLVEEGVSSILVLEASDYIGGRSKSLNSDGSINKGTFLGNFSNIPIEMGSEWQYTDSEMANYLEDNGLFEGIDLENSEDDVFGNYYMQSISTNGTITTEIMEDANPMYDLWIRWVAFRKEKLEEVDDVSWLGECKLTVYDDVTNFLKNLYVGFGQLLRSRRYGGIQSKGRTH